MGSKMAVHLYGPSETATYSDVVYNVNEEFLNKYGRENPILSLEGTYEVGITNIDTYINGKLLLAGNQVHIDDSTIKLLSTFTEGDVINIRLWYGKYKGEGPAAVSGLDMYRVQRELIDARGKFPFNYSTLGARLDDIQQMIRELNGSTENIVVTYEYDIDGNVVSELVSGAYRLRRDFEYYSDPPLQGELKTESVYRFDSNDQPFLHTKKRFEYNAKTLRIEKITNVKG